VAATAECEQSLEALPPPAPDREASQRQGLEQLEQRLRGLQECVERARHQAAEAEADLAAGEGGMRGWLAEAAAARQRLAERAGGAVG
jgi:hypothetical protein